MNKELSWTRHKNDHNFVMMTFQVRLKKTKKPTQSRLRFDLEKYRNPDVAGTFQATKGGKFAPRINMRDDDVDIDSMITTYNTAMTDKASEILGLVGCFGFNGPLRQYFSLYRAVSQREGERKEKR